MVTGLCLIILMMAKFWPETRTGQWLHRMLVEEVLAMAARIERKHLVFLVIGLFAMQSFAMVMTADMAVLAALDLASYVDVVLTAWTVAALARVKGLGMWTMRWRHFGARGRARVIGRRARRRPRTPMGHRAPANDDDGARVVLLAA